MFPYLEQVETSHSQSLKHHHILCNGRKYISVPALHWSITLLSWGNATLTVAFKWTYKTIPNNCLRHVRQQKKLFQSERNDFVRVDALHYILQRHPGGGFLNTRPQYHVSHCISPLDHCFTVSSHSVGSYFKRTLWHCGQLWPDVGMGWLGTRFHRRCNAIGDVAKLSSRVSSTCT